MNGFKDFIRRHSQQISHTCLLFICILFITCFMPREKSTTLDFKENTPWEHGQLIADFSFSVPKTAERITAERENVKKTTKPYFMFNPETGSNAGKRLKQVLDNNWTLMFTATPENQTARLKELYGKGIVSDSDAEFIRNNNYNDVIVLEGNRAETRSTKEFVSQSEAIRILASEESFIQSIGTAIHLDSLISPNYSLDINRTTNEVSNRLAMIDSTLTNIQKGQRIINRGDLIDHAAAQIIKTYLNEIKKIESAESSTSRTNIFIGQIMFVIIAMTLLYFYLYTYQPDVAKNTYKYTFTILATSVFPILIGIMLTNELGYVFILPYAIVPLMLCLFINSHTAFVVHMISILICSSMLGIQYEFVLLQLTAGCSVILSLKELESRSQMFRCVLISFFTYAIVYFCYNLIAYADTSHMRYTMFMYFAISALLTLIAYPMMIVFEKTFHFVSNVTLIELSNLNSKLLLKMSQEAPGTFQHSIQVSNLAAEGARAIGANSLLVRTGALYHDIGKTNNPIYFTENQNGGINPHSALTEVESAQIIIKHVTEGLEIAKHEGLPQSIQNFISTHHGLSKTGYFYISYKNAHPDEEVDESLFTYPGPKPTTREQAILMMADCVEAASHSLKEYTEENISSMVDNIIDKQVDSKTYSLSPLTFQDIDIIKNVFKTRLMAIYHTRISYPKENRKS
ncbi:MAG: HDIG domain-containing protein [Bacteroidaceae bacterium]|nr:HDIG domain-containing protein [Bacteroidaceae bacterium]